VLVVPAAFTDEQIRQAAAFRTSGRFPVLCWRDRESKAVIVRSSQPMVGMLDKSSEADVALIEQIRVASQRTASQLSIIDARPRVNAVVNKTKGAGSEKVSHYSRTNLHFMNIENIHVMRESKRKLRKLVFQTRSGKAVLFPGVTETGWLTHIQQLLQASSRVAAFVSTGVNCLVHCR
jgi:myotubularin-related protein 1/2